MTDQTPPPAAASGAPLSEADDKQWAGLSHLLGILGPIPALIIWLVFKDRGPKTDVEGKEALNFQITATIIVIGYSIVNAILTAVTFGFWAIIGWLPYLVVWVLAIVWSIMGFQAVNNGGSYRYPLNFRFIK